MKSCILASITIFFVGVCAAVQTTPKHEKDPSLMDIVSLIPRDQIEQIAHKHLKSDEGFKAAVKYMQSKEWKGLQDAIRHKPEWIRLKDRLHEVDIDIEGIVRCSNAFVDNITVAGTPTAKPNLRSFLKDVEMVIPVGQIILAIPKLTKSGGFKDLVDKIVSDETKKLVEDVLALEEIQKAIKALDDMGLMVNEFLDFSFAFLGWVDKNTTVQVK